MDDSPILHRSTRNLDCLGLTFTIANANLREVQPSGVDVHEKGGALPVVDTAPALTEGTAGVELASEAKRPPPPSLRRW